MYFEKIPFNFFIFFIQTNKHVYDRTRKFQSGYHSTFGDISLKLLNIPSIQKLCNKYLQNNICIEMVSIFRYRNFIKKIFKNIFQIFS